jgi:hypothetical protein
MKIIPFILQKASDAVLTFGTVGLSTAMNQFNAG